MGNRPGQPRRRSSNRTSVGGQASRFGGPVGEALGQTELKDDWNLLRRVD